MVSWKETVFSPVPLVMIFCIDANELANRDFFNILCVRSVKYVICIMLVKLLNKHSVTVLLMSVLDVVKQKILSESQSKCQ